MSYPGSKGQAGTFQRIIGQMPPHHTYVEAFYGGGYIFKTKRQADSEHLIDKRADLLPKGDVGVFPHCTDALDWLAVNGLLNYDQESTVIYCDPPYLLSTRQGRFYYDHEITDADHVRLLEILKRYQRAKILLSGYPSKLYSEALPDWRCISYRARTRGKTVTECLWANFPEPTELHDWRFAGKNFRERTSLKRLAARWLAKLNAMQPRKRGYVLNAIRERDGA
jgi:hypothetical protein